MQQTLALLKLLFQEKNKDKMQKNVFAHPPFALGHDFLYISKSKYYFLLRAQTNFSEAVKNNTPAFFAFPSDIRWEKMPLCLKMINNLKKTIWKLHD